MNPYHRDILKTIQSQSPAPTQHTFVDSYLGNDHPRYPISVPMLRTIASEWMRTHPNVTGKSFTAVLTSLAKGKSSTEKCMVGIMLDYATADQRKFDPSLFDVWLNYLVGWAEVDSLCTGKYMEAEIPAQWPAWKKLILDFSKNKNINKRRASLVVFCSPLRSTKDDRLPDFAFMIIDRLKHENEILITKAISWVLRNMEKNYRKQLKAYLRKNKDSLPKIAVRETMAKLDTGVKNKKRKA